MKIVYKHHSSKLWIKSLAVIKSCQGIYIDFEVWFILTARISSLGLLDVPASLIMDQILSTLVSVWIQSNSPEFNGVITGISYIFQVYTTIIQFIADDWNEIEPRDVTIKWIRCSPKKNVADDWPLRKFPNFTLCLHAVYNFQTG